MASIYKRGSDKKRKGSAYYISYTDHTGKRCTTKGYSDKGLTQQLAARLEHEAKLRRDGLVDAEMEHCRDVRQAPIKTHLATFERALQSRANTTRYVSLIVHRIEFILKGAEIDTLENLTGERVQDYLTTLRTERHYGARTYNHYLQAIDGFSRWLVQTKRLTTNPLLGVARLNTAVDVRHKRRALTADEVSRLIASAEQSGKDIQTYSGDLRGKLYLFSYMTGLRRRELSKLTSESFDLNAVPPTLTIEAAASKHRKLDVLPLHPNLVELLRQWLPTLAENERLFPKLERKRTWFMVKKDLERAGIPYRTKEGVADFHAAGRHSYVTALLKSGVTLPEARELARHSDVRMTMRYTHIGIEDQSRALARLPSPAQRLSSAPDVFGGQEVAEGDNGRQKGPAKEKAVSPCDSDTCDASCRSLSEPDGACQDTPKEWRRRESNPRPAIAPWSLLRA